MLLTASIATDLACRSCFSARPLLLQSFRCASSQSIQKPIEIISGKSKERLSTLISARHSLPLFSIPSSRVHLIEQPCDFYTELLAIISRARRRIFLASLYIGKTEIDLINHLRSALNTQPGLQVTILADSLRSTREGEYQDSTSTSSCASLLASLQRDYPDRVQVRLYRAPDLPQWLERLVGKRFVEGWGLQHMKIYGGDDEVMISGANLSNDYFTNRRDRYIRLQDKQFSQYMYHLLMIAARYSYSVSSIKSNKAGDKNHSAFELLWEEGRKLPITVDGISRGSKKWKAAMRNEVEELTAKYHKESRSELKEKLEKEETIEVVPLLQMGPLRINQETTCVPLVLQAADTTMTRLDFTTGYFSLNPGYANYILNGNFSSNMITASPKANGFYGSRGTSGYLPAAYTWLESRFWKRLIANKRQDSVTIREWGKEGWTYHAKGIWLYPNGQSKPSVTLIGSSNFGTRSASLDLECTLLVDASESESIQARLKEEVEELQKDANDIVGLEMFNREERKVPWGVKIAAWCIKRML